MEHSPLDDLRADVTIELPFALYLPNGKYDVSRSGYVYAVQLERVKQERFDQRLGIAAGDFDILNDRHGLVRYTRATITMPRYSVFVFYFRALQAKGIDIPDKVEVKLEASDLTDKYADAAFELALGVLNQLINAYRLVTHLSYVRPLAPEEVFGRNLSWWHGTEMVSGAAGVSFGRGVTLPVTDLDPQLTEGIKDILANDRWISDAFLLLEDARDHFSRREYRLALIDGYSAVEILLDDILVLGLKMSSTSIDEAVKMLKAGKNESRDYASLEEVVSGARVEYKLKRGLKRVYGLHVPTAHPALWKDWEFANSVRVRATHRANDITRDEALRALEAMNQLTDVIGRRVVARPPEGSQAEKESIPQRPESTLAE